MSRRAVLRETQATSTAYAAQEQHSKSAAAAESGSTTTTSPSSMDQERLLRTEYAAAAAFLQDADNNKKVTRAMRQSLLELLEASLTCPLCGDALVQPVSLIACAHTFCCSCIDRHVDNSWTCPSTYDVYVCVCNIACVCVGVVCSSL
jgi:Zinc finger, C3HC4 type (RING finger)